MIKGTLLSRDDRNDPKVKAVLDAVECLDEDVAGKVLSHAVQRLYKDLYVKNNPDVKETTGRITANHLLGRRDDFGRGSQPPGFDHGDLWIKNGKPFSLTWHPYALDEGTLRDLVKWLDERPSLYLTIHAGSWYYPFVTLFMELRLRKNLGF